MPDWPSRQPPDFIAGIFQTESQVDFFNGSNHRAFVPQLRVEYSCGDRRLAQISNVALPADFPGNSHGHGTHVRFIWHSTISEAGLHSQLTRVCRPRQFFPRAERNEGAGRPPASRFHHGIVIEENHPALGAEQRRVAATLNPSSSSRQTLTRGLSAARRAATSGVSSVEALSTIRSSVSSVICGKTLSTARFKRRARFRVQMATVINGVAAVEGWVIGSLPVTAVSSGCSLDFQVTGTFFDLDVGYNVVED